VYGSAPQLLESAITMSPDWFTTATSGNAKSRAGQEDDRGGCRNRRVAGAPGSQRCGHVEPPGGSPRSLHYKDARDRDLDYAQSRDLIPCRAMFFPPRRRMLSAPGTGHRDVGDAA